MDFRALEQGFLFWQAPERRALQATFNHNAEGKEPDETLSVLTCCGTALMPEGIPVQGSCRGRPIELAQSAVQAQRDVAPPAYKKPQSVFFCVWCDFSFRLCCPLCCSMGRLLQITSITRAYVCLCWFIVVVVNFLVGVCCRFSMFVCWFILLGFLSTRPVLLSDRSVVLSHRSVSNA